MDTTHHQMTLRMPWELCRRVERHWHSTGLDDHPDAVRLRNRHEAVIDLIERGLAAVEQPDVHPDQLALPLEMDPTTGGARHAD